MQLENCSRRNETCSNSAMRCDPNNFFSQKYYTIVVVDKASLEFLGSDRIAKILAVLIVSGLATMQSGPLQILFQQ